MQTLLSAILVLILLLGAGVGPAGAVDVGDRVDLVSTRSDGVPLHERSENSFRGERAPNHTLATIVAAKQNGLWVQVRLDDGRIRWIVRKYIRRVVSSSESRAMQDPEARVWDSPEGCHEVVRSGARMNSRTSEKLRLATWNIRWFPDGKKSGKGKNTPNSLDIAWLTCTLAWLNVDVIAVQEIMNKPAANKQLKVIAKGLNAELGGDWQVSTQSCGYKNAQRIGFLWDANRVMLSETGSLWHFNARATSSDNPCEGGRRRPGHYARVQVSGGGVDFHLISVHLKSGASEYDQDSRRTALSRIPDAVAQLFQNDSDIIILGDFNTMGHGGAGSAKSEIVELQNTLGAQTPPWRHVQVEPACTEYYQGKGGWLDHVMATSAMTEIADRTARVTGYCAVAGCSRLPRNRMPRAYHELSDHCPIVVNLTNVDHD